MKRIVLAAAAALMTLTASRASAADTALLTVTANVAQVCNVEAAALSFGSYDPLSASPTDGAAAVTVTCTNGTPWSLTLSANSGSMTGPGASSLSYALYSDAARGTDFPTAGGAAMIGDGTAQTVQVYGRVPAGQNLVLAGLHTGSVTMTVNY
jgi:spore coat protein U-like protein